MIIKNRTDGVNTGNVVSLDPKKAARPAEAASTVDPSSSAATLQAIRQGVSRNTHNLDIYKTAEIRQALDDLLCEVMGDCPDPMLERLRNLVRNG
ncbi:MAG: hypothetical protein HYT76_06080 [Deltaproteobacteria bacterium]|nr:hypothetical protein [Deltaproteobacteria bacterium]